MSNKTNNKGSKTRVEEFRERLNREDLERRWQLEALDHLFTEVEDHPESFHRLWVQPLVASGLTLESALALLVESHFRPN
ncbi:MAG TPA: hypothetical protein VFF95_05640 [Candidatus Binatus sp.]|jgi:hypothetical protein|nr:hypothetical protein [Candidatus Binatus sp.]